MPTEIPSLTPEAQRALGPAISSVIRGSKTRTLGEPPREIPEPNHLTKTGNRLLFGGAMMSTGSVMTAVSGGPDGTPMQIVFALGVCSMVAGNIALIIGNGSKIKEVETAPVGELKRIPAGHLGAYTRIQKARLLGRPLTEEEKEEIAKEYDAD